MESSVSHPALEDPDFRTAVEFARALANRNEAKKISPLFSLCAFAVAWRAGQLKTALKQSGSASGDIEQAAAAATARAKPLNTLDNAAIPTPSTLRFVGALLNTMPDWAIAAILREGGAREIAQIGSAVARADGIKAISPQLLVAGALVAYHQGAMVKRPSICEHLRINDTGIQALIDGLAVQVTPKQEVELSSGPNVASATKKR
jgi:hypothetical protein